MRSRALGALAGTCSLLANVDACGGTINPDASADASAEVGADAIAKSGLDASDETGFDDVSNWTKFDLAALDASNSNYRGFAGAAFDGRYVYFVPTNSYGSLVVRLDTTMDMASLSAWSTFDVASTNAGAAGFAGAVFDGRYLYLVPWYSITYNGLIVRFDTTAPFTSSQSWSSFDLTTVNAKARGFQGGTFDGRYVYLSPWNGGVAARFDTQGSLDSLGAWSTFDIATANSKAGCFVGALFDGKFVYFVPSWNNAYLGNVVARVDTTADFTAAGSWSTFDVAAVNAGARGFYGGAFDGEYLYLVPYYDGTNWDGIVARYDLTASFTSTSGWSTFDAATINPGSSGFFGGAFDGRYIYFVPSSRGAEPKGVFTRLDPKGSFDSSTSWSTFQVVDSGSEEFSGGVFDGQYVYFYSYDTIVRFAAKAAPAPLPKLPGWSGSFF